jgi:hypothetical protein
MATLKMLKKFARKLNKTELAEEIDLDQSADDLQEEFVSAIEEIDDEGQTDDVDDDVLDFYESLIDEGEEEGGGEEETEEETEEEEEEEEEAREDETGEEEDEFDDMDRAELKKYNKEADCGVRVVKSMSDDDLRDAIREAAGVEEEEEEEEEAPKKKRTVRRKATGKKTTGKKTTGKRTGRKATGKKTTGKRTTGKKTTTKKTSAKKRPTGVAEVTAQVCAKYKGKAVKYTTLAETVAKQRGKEGAPADMNSAKQYVRIITTALCVLGFAKEVNEDSVRINKK